MVNGDITGPHRKKGGIGGRLLIIPAKGASYYEDYEGWEPTDEELRKHINNGWLEQVPALVRHGTQLCIAYVDEEGLLKDLPFNETASRLIRSVHKIVGTMIVVVPTSSASQGDKAKPPGITP
jgi:hypothetical protein